MANWFIRIIARTSLKQAESHNPHPTTQNLQHDTGITIHNSKSSFSPQV